jgi:histidinol-phosphate/aromatic aminotransferase/cobyric acid decarboxylase-like protein/GNAT superfamily N-acetyltransferase
MALADEDDRQAIYRMRHDVYAAELHQHHENDLGELRDPLDAFNIYLVARDSAGALAGFVSVTPPGHGKYSIDKYLARDQLPFQCDRDLYEVRLLTVAPAHRRGPLASLLMYAAWRYIDSHGGQRIVAIGRQEVLSIYLKCGLVPLGRRIVSGKVTFELLSASVDQLRETAVALGPALSRLGEGVDWRLDFPFRPPARCFHGGAFFDAIGNRFDSLDRRNQIINADVLDAWFDPAPAVTAALLEALPWLLRTSPPAACEGMVAAIAQHRNVPAACVLPAAGSSDLIFLALRHWLTPGSRVLLTEPTYGEYAHVLEQVIGCRVIRLMLSREDGYVLRTDALQDATQPGRTACGRANIRADIRADCRQDLRAGTAPSPSSGDYSLIILVNPNSPTGRHIPRLELEDFLRGLPATTRVWIDETYIEYTGPDQSLEKFAAASSNVVVCKSMSKVYALSGVRTAYLVGPAALLAELRAITPPWAVSLPAQVAAVKALESPDYYADCYHRTHALRQQLAEDLAAIAPGMEVIPGTANFLLCHLPEPGPDAAAVVAACRERGVFLRDAKLMGSQLGRHALRVAVKSAEQNAEVVSAIAQALGTA